MSYLAKLMAMPQGVEDGVHACPWVEMADLGTMPERPQKWP